MSVVSFHEVPSLVDESDDEEAMERNAFRIEEVVAGFIDEAPIRHDIIPESDSDSDAEEEEGQTLSKKQRTRDRDRLRRSDGNLFEGQLFFNGVAFKEAVLDYALKTGYNLKQYRYDKTKLGYCCAGRNVDSVCGWRIYFLFFGYLLFFLDTTFTAYNIGMISFFLGFSFGLPSSLQHNHIDSNVGTDCSLNSTSLEESQSHTNISLAHQQLLTASLMIHSNFQTHCSSLVFFVTISLLFSPNMSFPNSIFRVLPQLLRI